MTHSLPDLPYTYSALEPHIDAQTMEIHHTKHHQAYIDKLNKALENHPELQDKTIEELIKNLDTVPEDIRSVIRNNGGGHLNHSFFWKILAPENGEKPSELTEAINKNFGSFEKFKEDFTTSATSHFGSGWTWLVKDQSKLLIMTTPNQDSPLTQRKNPILGLDVWEHAYYLKYQNKRAEYVEAFFNIIDWDQVHKNFQS